MRAQTATTAAAALPMASTGVRSVCHARPGSSSPSCAAVAARSRGVTPGSRSSKASPVPTAPPSCTGKGAASTTSIALVTASSQVATCAPTVVASACWPRVRAIDTVDRSARASPSRLAPAARSRPRTASSTRLATSTRPESRMSWLVAPSCTRHPDPGWAASACARSCATSGMTGTPPSRAPASSASASSDSTRRSAATARASARAASSASPASPDTSPHASTSARSTSTSAASTASSDAAADAPPRGSRSPQSNAAGAVIARRPRTGGTPSRPRPAAGCRIGSRPSRRPRRRACRDGPRRRSRGTRPARCARPRRRSTPG